MKKNLETPQRRLTLNRETLQRLENPELLAQVQGGTSQLCTTTKTGAGLNAVTGYC